MQKSATLQERWAEKIVDRRSRAQNSGIHAWWNVSVDPNQLPITISICMSNIVISTLVSSPFKETVLL